MKSELYIHAGFPKCASSSIQSFLRVNLSELHSESFGILGDGFSIGSDKRSNPLWFLESRRKDGSNLADLLINALSASQSTYSKYVISSENLNKESFAESFSGIDSIFNVTVVFYVRPQCDWLASAWKQFELHKGKRLSLHLDQAMDKKFPKFLPQIKKWMHCLPNSKVLVRPLKKDYLKGSSPIMDFSEIIGYEGRLVYGDEGANPSFDYSLMHALMKNHDLFSMDSTPGRFLSRFNRLVPNPYRRTNIEMLNDDFKNRIERAFLAENTELAELMCPHDMDVVEFYNDFFKPRPKNGLSYIEKCEEHLDRRVRSILSDIDPSVKEYPDIRLMLSKILGSN